MDSLPSPAESSVSPSLGVTRRGLRAFEIKFILDEATAAAVEARLASFLTPDPHADPATGAYTITSIYCDTPGWDVYLREGRHASRKYRVRRYGDGPTFVERKTVRKSIVRKRRSRADGDDLQAMVASEACPDTAWFARQVSHADLRPVCRISYQRRALFGAGSEGPMRLTFDRHIRGHPLSQWSFNGVATPRTLFDSVVVCEFKFRNAMPAPMKDAVAAFRLEPRGVSKYRACIAAFSASLGLPSGAPHA